MKSILKVKFKAIDYYTMNKVSFSNTITSEGNNFKDKQTKPMPVNGGKYVLPSITLTASELASDWVGTQSSLLNDIINDPKRELHCILDWDIVSIKNISASGKETTETAPKQQNIKYDALALFEIIVAASDTIDEQTKVNFLHTYKEMKDSLKGLTVEKKISVVLAAMGVGFKASGEAYRRMSAILSGKDPNQIDEPTATKLITS